MLATLLALALCVGAGAIGGVFLGFSSFVMRALSQIPPVSGIAAMQRINVVVLNRVFLGFFMGTAALSVAAIVLALTAWSTPRSALLIAAGLLYLVGTFGVTMRCNVPRNNHLARLVTDSAEAQAYWPVYVREWTFWNHVRTAAALVACGCAALAL